MARRTATINKKPERAVIIGAGITEKYYFSHLQSLYNLKIKVRPRYFGNENISTLEKLIKQVLDNEGLAIVVFDADVSSWNTTEAKRLQDLKRKYEEALSADRVVGLVIGSLACWAGVRLGGRHLDNHWPEVLNKVKETHA